MNLYLLRHGEAESHAPSDAERQLTEQGKQDIRQLAAKFRDRQYPVDHYFVSPYLRAQQTAGLFLEELGKPVKFETSEKLTPEIRASVVIRFLDAMAETDNILLVSHNPLLSELLALLKDGDIRQLRILEAGQMAVLAMEHPGLGQASLEAILDPSN